MRRFGFGFALAAVFAVSAAAQDKDAVTIKIAYPQAGQRAKVTVEEKTTTKTVINIQGMLQTQEEVKSKSLVYTDDVIDNPKNEKRAAKLKRTYEKAVIGTGKDTKKLPIEGKTVLIEKKGDKYSFTIDGKAVEGDSLKLLEEEFNRPKKGDVRDVMFPKTPVKPGDTWKIPPDELVKELGEEGLVLDKNKVTAGGTLVKAYKKDGKQFGVIEIVVEGPVTSLGEKVPLTLKEGKMVVKFTGEGCIDGSSPTGTTNAQMTFGISGTAMGADIKVVVEGTEKRTQQELPKK
jgi:hypothetical protein